MENNKLYYTDGHEVTITDSGFKVRRNLYPLKDIVRHGFSVITPTRFPFFAVMILGAAVFGTGAFNFTPSTWVKTVTVLDLTLPANLIIMVSGLIFFVAGMVLVVRLREKYAVRIFNGAVEKDVVISQSKEYISQIINALNRAFLDFGQETKTPIRGR